MSDIQKILSCAYFIYREEKPSIKELSKEHTHIEEISSSEENKLPSGLEGEEGSEGSESEKSNTGRDFVMVQNRNWQ